MQDSVRSVGSRRQLFIDEAFFAKTDGVKLTMNQPRKTDERTLYADKPWESSVGGCDTIVRMGKEYWWYYDAFYRLPPDKPVMFYGEPWKEPVRFMCLAVSTDGVHWEKPNLGLVDFGGSKDNNILFPPNIYGWGGPNHVFVDTRPGTPEDEKYKSTFLWDGPDGDLSGGLWILKSADGIHWSLVHKERRWEHEEHGST